MYIVTKIPSRKLDFSMAYKCLIVSEGEPDAWVSGMREMTQFLGLLASQYVKPNSLLDVSLPVVRQPEELARHQTNSI